MRTAARGGDGHSPRAHASKAIGKLRRLGISVAARYIRGALDPGVRRFAWGWERTSFAAHVANVVWRPFPGHRLLDMRKSTEKAPVDGRMQVPGTLG